MSKNTEVSSVSRRLFLAVAGGAAAANSFAVGETVSSAVKPACPKPTSYAVTIDVRTDPFSYSATDACGNTHKANRHAVTGGDSAAWNVKTPLATGATLNYHITIFCVKETPLVDFNTGTNPVFALHGATAEANAGTVKAKIDTEASGSYEYYVAITDDNTGITYTDDPKIIVGGGGTYEQALIKNANDLIEEAHKLKDAAGSDRALKDRIQSIEKNLGEVVHNLE